MGATIKLLKDNPPKGVKRIILIESTGKLLDEHLDDYKKIGLEISKKACDQDEFKI